MTVYWHQPVSFLLITDVKCLRVHWTSKTDCYHLADVQSRDVGLPADGPQEAVHFLDGSDLLLVILLLWVSGNDGHLQAFVRFTHGLHLRVLPEVDASVLQLSGTVCAEEVVKIPQNLQRESMTRTQISVSIRARLHISNECLFLKSMWFLLLSVG